MRVEADFLHTDQHQSYTAINCLRFSLILKPRDRLKTKYFCPYWLFKILINIKVICKLILSFLIGLGFSLILKPRDRLKTKYFCPYWLFKILINIKVICKLILSFLISLGWCRNYPSKFAKLGIFWSSVYA